jgi:4,5-dihydroxyphthalate decarboxylase
MYINTAAGIAAPRDLIGKRVGLRSFQTTLSVLAKGDLQHEYGVPLDQVTWVSSADEPVPFAPPPGGGYRAGPA